ncbi:hypothetical protein HUJ04_006014 [Dendroctonus ponderosae]|nr:hypothetical protein HUJ04_006014 [Dendroctonus ponderosae]
MEDLRYRPFSNMRLNADSMESPDENPEALTKPSKQTFSPHQMNLLTLQIKPWIIISIDASKNADENASGWVEAVQSTGQINKLKVLGLCAERKQLQDKTKEGRAFSTSASYRRKSEEKSLPEA